MWCFKPANICSLLRGFSRLMAASLLLTTLSSCGFQPLYGINDQRPGALAAIAAIDVAPIPNRIGQVLRTALMQYFQTAAATTPKTLRLHITLAENRADLLILPNATVRFAKMTLSAQFSLRRLRDDKVLIRATSTAISSFNPQTSEYAKQIAENAARKRAIEAIAVDIRQQIALFLRQQRLGAPAS